MEGAHVNWPFLVATASCRRASSDIKIVYRASNFASVITRTTDAAGMTSRGDVEGARVGGGGGAAFGS